MAIFISLRCEGRGEGLPELDPFRCKSDDNSDPWVLTDDTKKSAYECLSELFQNAESSGWQRTKTGWMCPNCIEHVKKQEVV